MYCRPAASIVRLFALLLVSTALFAESRPEKVTTYPGAPHHSLSQPTGFSATPSQAETPLLVSRWACLLQADATKSIPANRYDTVVIDYSRDGTEQGRYSATDLANIRALGVRNILSYLSIGEAESYRYYFNQSWVDSKGGQTDSAPAWLGRLNPDWPGNYKVQYWSEEWQQIILGYLGHILDAGFDGVYLDIVDAFEYWATPGNGERFTVDEKDTAAYMMHFIERLAAYARRRNPDFHIVIQNAERILDFDTNGEFLRTIDGIGVEDLYYNGRVPESAEWTSARRGELDRFVAAGKPVMVIDYVYAGTPTDSRVRSFIARATADHYVPYPAWSDRRLDRVSR